MIVKRIFESITITIQQLNQDASANSRIIITSIDNQFRNTTESITSNFNLMKIYFQTMNENQ
jgi:hypothetical protein